MNRVEFFRATAPFELQETINTWCKENDKEPISISLSHCGWWYVAAVVVKELYSD